MKLGAMVGLAVLLATGFIEPAVAQDQDNCNAPELTAGAGPNIFTPQLEGVLGDLSAAEPEFRDIRLTTDPSVTDYVQQIGDRLARQLPPSGLQFRYFVFEASYPDAFSMPGGRIYISRKLILFSKSEGELAGVIAHEMGHIVTHQGAQDMTRLFRDVLKVTALADGQDLRDKFNALKEQSWRNPKAFRETSKESNERQMAADQVGIYAMAKAGYDPNDFGSFYDRLAETEGQTGSWLSALLHAIPPDQARLRQIVTNVKRMPASCIETLAATDERFTQFKRVVFNFSGWDQHNTERLPGLVSKIKLVEPLGASPEISILRFSPDGKHLLAADKKQIYVFSREPFELLFQIPADTTADAHFTPDSQSLSFVTGALRVETWDVASRKRTSAYEQEVPKGCPVKSLAPDGKTLACISGDRKLLLFDVASQAKLLDRDFDVSFTVGGFFMFGPGAFQSSLAFSPDGRYFVASNPGASVAFDTRGRSVVKLSGELGKAISAGFFFIDSDRAIGRNFFEDGNVHLIDWTAGKIGKKLPIGFNRMRPAAHGDYVVLDDTPHKHPSVVISVDTGKMVIASTQRAFDIYDNVFVAQTTQGEIALYNANPVALKAHLALPGARLNPQTVVASDNLRWLALSREDHGAIWDLNGNKHVADLIEFDGGWFNGDAWFYTDFPKAESTTFELGRVSLFSGKPEGAPLPDPYVQQKGPYLVVTTPAKSPDNVKEDQVPILALAGSAAMPAQSNTTMIALDGGAAPFSNSFLGDNPCGAFYRRVNTFGCNVTQEVRDARNGTSLWSRTFPKDAPAFIVLPERDKVVLNWQIVNDAVRDEIKNYPDLLKQYNATDDKRTLQFVEIADLQTGKLLNAALLQSGQVINDVQPIPGAEDALVLLRRNRTAVQRSFNDDDAAEFPGVPVAASVTGFRLATLDEYGRSLTIYDIKDEKKLQELSFAEDIVYVRFSADGKRLLVLTDSQTAYLLDVPTA